MLEQLKIPSVYGNHEEWSEEGRLFLSPPGMPNQLTPEAVAWLESLPFRLRIRAAATPATIGVVHSFEEWTYVKQDSVERLSAIEDCQVVFCGHTHKPAIWTLARGKQPKVRRLNPRSAKGVEVKLDPHTQYVVDAGSLARPSFGRALHEERATYAVFDMAAGTLALRAVDLTPRLQAMLRRMTERPPDTSSG